MPCDLISRLEAWGREAGLVLGGTHGPAAELLSSPGRFCPEGRVCLLTSAAVSRRAFGRMADSPAESSSS